jgi:hypothetical protein
MICYTFCISWKEHLIASVNIKLGEKWEESTIIYYRQIIARPHCLTLINATSTTNEEKMAGGRGIAFNLHEDIAPDEEDNINVLTQVIH